MANLKGWKRVSFAEMAVNVNDRVDDPSTAGVERYVGLEHIDPESLDIARWGHPTDVEATKLRFGAGDVIFGRRRAYQRKLAVAEFDGICSAHAMVLRAKPTVVLPEFLPFFMQSDLFFERAIAISRGSMSPTINWEDLAAEQFQVPSLEEQREISQVLWAAERCVRRYDTLSGVLVESKRATLRHALDRGAWQRASIGSVADVQNGTTPRKNRRSYWDGGTIPWLPTGKVHERVISSADQFITQSALKECSLSLIPAGSVLVAMIGQGKTRGATAYLMLEATINQNFAAITTGEEMDSRFLFYFLETRYDNLRRISQGSNQGALNCQIIREYEVPLPPKQEQQHIIEMAEVVDQATLAAGSQAELARQIKRALMSNLLEAQV